jgi:molecular chaperone GrpE (heat shock protein)
METDTPEKSAENEVSPGAEAILPQSEDLGPSREAPVPEAAPVELGDVPVHSDEFGPMMNEIQKQILMIARSQDRNDQKLTQIDKDFYQFIKIQDGMQEELEKHRAGLFRQLLDPLLSTIGRIYNENIVNVEKIEDAKLRKNFKYLFEELEQVLTENGVEVYTSAPGDSFSAKYCRIQKKIPTDKKEFHGKVKESHNKGFHIGPRVLAPENVDVYVFDSTTKKEE